jgi:hypothetical protein
LRPIADFSEMIDHHAHLEQANRHIEAAETRIAEQYLLIVKLEARSCPAAEAKALLSAMRGTLAEMKRHRSLIEYELAGIGLDGVKRA